MAWRASQDRNSNLPLVCKMADGTDGRESGPQINSFLTQTELTLGKERVIGNTTPTLPTGKSKKDPILKINLKEGKSKLLNVTWSEDTSELLDDSIQNLSIESDDSIRGEDNIVISKQELQAIIERVSKLEEELRKLKNRMDHITKLENITPTKNVVTVLQSSNFSDNKIEMAEGDLLNLDSNYAIALCIAGDCAMSDGLAKKIKETFGSITDDNKNIHEIGHIIKQESNDKTILHVITKQESAKKPTWKHFKKSMYNLAKKCEELQIKQLALPKLGTGLDGLEWAKIMKVLKHAFQSSQTTVTVIYLSPEKEREYRKSVRNRRINTQETKEYKPQVEILGDSHVKGISAILKQSHNKVSSITMPGAPIQQLINNLNCKTAHLTPHDFFVFVGGTNDLKIDNSLISASFNKIHLDSVLSQAKHTNVVISTVPQRYDNLESNQIIQQYNELMSEYINNYKSQSKYQDRITILDFNKAVNQRELYTMHGLHLNVNGKTALASAIMDLTVGKYFQEN